LKKEITRIEPWSAVRVGFFFGILLGLVFGLFNGVLIKYLSGTSASSLLPPDAKELSSFSGGAMVALAIVMALIFSLLWALIGAVGAIFYNAVANLFGGLEFRTGADDTPHSADSRMPSEPDDEDAPHE
jgi:hypothetical protein